MTSSPSPRDPYALSLHDIQKGLGWLQRRLKDCHGRPAGQVLLCLEGEEVIKILTLLEAAEHGIATLEVRTAEDVGRTRSRKKR